MKNLRDPDSGLPLPQVRANVPAGALVLLPYFKLQQPSEQEKADKKDFIDSNSFISKTKSALKYYADNLNGVEAMYYLGDEAGQPMANNPGRAEQLNQAHLLELIGALAIPHFLAQPASQLDRQNPAYHEFGLKDDAKPVDFSQFSTQLRLDVAEPLIRLHYFARYFQHHLAEEKSAPFYSAGKLGDHLPAGTGPLKDLAEMLAEYQEWLRELGNNDRRFAGINLDQKEFNKMVADKEIKVSTFSFNKGLTESVLRVELNNAVGKSTLGNPDAPRVLRWIVEAFDKATTKAVKEKLQYN